MIYFTLVQFNTLVEVSTKSLFIEAVYKLNERNYTPSGCTALYDAITQAIYTTDRALMKMSIKPKTQVTIQTDGGKQF